jgi:hypothetical protein
MNPLSNLRSLSLTAIVTISLVCGILQPAHAGTPDPRIRSALDKAGLQYEITGDGDFKVIFKFNEDKRSQVILINSNTERIKETNIEIREIYSVAYKTNGNLPVEVANQLMKDSQKRKIGAWELINTSAGVSLAVFDAKISADTSTDNLVKIMRLVAIRADNMEQELTGEDKF